LALGEALTGRGQLAEAETMLVRAQEVMKKTYTADAAETKEVSAALRELHDRMKKPLTVAPSQAAYRGSPRSPGSPRDSGTP
jgi:hypothetical protein